MKNIYPVLLAIGLVWGMAAEADVPPPPPLEKPTPTKVKITPLPATTANLSTEKLIGTPPPNFAPIEPKLVDIPAGTFTMGCVNGRDNVDGVKQCSDATDEIPAHEVTIKAFRMGMYEVTFDEWDACVGNGACPKIDNQDSGWGRGNRPVINVSWDDTQIYIGWLNKRTGKHYRLPTDAEWEYAARGNDNAAYPWGYQANHEFANYGKGECCGGLTNGKDRWENTAPVGQFSANAFGLYDMHGNVWEWVQDKYHNSYQGAPTDGSAWKSGDSSDHILRGGGWWDDSTAGLRSAKRGEQTHDNRNPYFGFRLAIGQN